MNAWKYGVIQSRELCVTEIEKDANTSQIFSMIIMLAGVVSRRKNSTSSMCCCK